MIQYKKAMSLLILIVFSAMLTTQTVFAANESAYSVEQKANILYANNLFSGCGEDLNGEPIFALDGQVTRGQAIVMLVRILGKEPGANYNARTLVDPIPFTDVPNWCYPSVKYAYNNGLTSGTSDTTFSPDQKITGTEFLVFALSALGYNAETDYAWANAAQMAAKLGLIDDGMYVNPTDSFSRADAVEICYNTLCTKIKGSDTTLAESIGLDVSSLPKLPAIVNRNFYDVDLLDAESGFWLFNPETQKEDSISIHGLKSGAILRHPDLKYDISKSNSENLQNYLKTIKQYDEVLKFRGLGPEYPCCGHFEITGHKDVYLQSSKSGWYVEIPSWDSNYLEGKNNMWKERNPDVVEPFEYYFNSSSYELWRENYYNEYDCRSIVPEFDKTLFLNAMIYFGDEDMAKAVYSLIDYHYSKRTDNNNVITPEVANKFGLTIETDEISTDIRRTVTATVSNGLQTWTIKYHLANWFDFADTSVTMA